MISLDFIADALDGDGDFDDIDMDKFDLDGDGQITANDCPFVPGSAEAKLWFRNIMEPSVTHNITPEMQAKYGDQVIGAYKGKPLVPSEMGSDQGDFQFLVDKIKIIHGLNYSSAMKIASKVKFMKYGV